MEGSEDSRKGRGERDSAIPKAGVMGHPVSKPFSESFMGDRFPSQLFPFGDSVGTGPQWIGQPKVPPSLTFEQMAENLRELRKKLGRPVLLVVVHSPQDFNRILRAMPAQEVGNCILGDLIPQSVATPEIIIFPPAAEEGKVCFISDRDAATAIKAAYNAWDEAERLKCANRADAAAFGRYVARGGRE